MIHTLVSDWMAKNPIVVRPETGIIDAYQLMIEHRIRRLPIVASGQLVGIVTLSDLYQVKPLDVLDKRIHSLYQKVEQMTVEEVMTSNPITVTQDATIAEAAEKMLTCKISGLPVIDKVTGGLIGIITESDIFRLVAQEWSTRKHGSVHLPPQSK